MGTQKGRLFELARMYHTYQKKNVREKKRANDKQSVQIKGGHFDEGKSISLSYNFDMYPEVLNDSHRRQTEASQMSFFDGNTSEAFYVEPFEAEETIEVPYGEARPADDDAKLDRIARGFASPNDEIEGMENDEGKMKEVEEKPDSVWKPDVDSAAMEASDPGVVDKEKQADTTREQRPLEQEAVSDKRKEEARPYDASDEEFARDIGAILQGQKVYDATQKKSVDKRGSDPERVSKGESNAPGKATAAQDEMMDPNKNEHKIFEKIAQSMTFANSYDLGSIALNEKFELMDQEIEKEEVNKILRQKRSNDIGDADVVESEPSAKVHDPARDAVSMGVEKYDPAGALDNNNGGRLIGEDVLHKGDLILTSSSGAFDMTEGALGSESIAGLYLGGNKLLTKSAGGGLEEKPLQPHLGSKGVMVTLRHQSMSAETSSSIVDALTKLGAGPEARKQETWLKVSCPAISVHPDVCSSEEVTEKEKCNAYAGRIYLGTMNNDSFTCAESIVNAFEKNQMGFVALLSKEHNGSLKYLGHLKNKA